MLIYLEFAIDLSVYVSTVTVRFAEKLHLFAVSTLYPYVVPINFKRIGIFVLEVHGTDRARCRVAFNDICIPVYCELLRKSFGVSSSDQV